MTSLPGAGRRAPAPQTELPKEQKRAKPISQRHGASSAQFLCLGPQSVPTMKWLEWDTGPLGGGAALSLGTLVGGGFHQ